MNCRDLPDQLGRFLDGELEPASRRAVEAHLCECGQCSEELDALRMLATDLAAPTDTRVPEELWPAIQQSLEARPTGGPHPAFGAFARPLRAAAVVLLALGLGWVGLRWMEGGGRAEAATVNFGMLLDEVQLDPQAAFQKFLSLYAAEQVDLSVIKQCAQELNFELPNSLPGGFELQAAYCLRFGSAPGVAAWYERDGEPLVTIFHPPVQTEDFGTHKDYPCLIGEHRGHKIEAGQWKMVHLTDPTTCHCVLSRLDEHTELPAVMNAIAPVLRSKSNPGHQHH